MVSSFFRGIIMFFFLRKSRSNPRLCVTWTYYYRNLTSSALYVPWELWVTYFTKGESCLCATKVNLPASYFFPVQPHWPRGLTSLLLFVSSVKTDSYLFAALFVSLFKPSPLPIYLLLQSYSCIFFLPASWNCRWQIENFCSRLSLIVPSSQSRGGAGQMYITAGEGNWKTQRAAPRTINPHSVSETGHMLEFASIIHTVEAKVHQTHQSR